MEEQTLTPVTSGSQPSKTKPLLLTVLAIILILAAGAGVYFWQHNKVKALNLQVNGLQAKLSAETTTKSSASSKASSAATIFTYKPKTGGLALTLPTSYGIIVNVDGNNGGAPGAVFKVASVTNANQFSDAAYQGVQINIGNTFTNLNNAVQSEETQLSGQTTANRDYQVSDSTVAGLPAKLIKANGVDEYQGNVSVYLVGSGSFLYTINANGTQNSSFPLLDAVLKGLTIKPVTL